MNNYHLYTQQILNLLIYFNQEDVKCALKFRQGLRLKSDDPAGVLRNQFIELSF